MFCMALAAPQYGAPAPPPAPVKAEPAKIIEQKPTLVCATHYTTIWDTEYKTETVEECKTHYEKQCQLESQRLCQDTTKEECRIVQDKVWDTVYQKVCVDEYKTVYEPYTETECVTLYKEDCEYQWEGTGSSKIWAPIAGTCKKNPYDECKDVEKTNEKLVAYPACKDVPEEKCSYVDRKECYLFPDKVCKSEQIQKCYDVPREVCTISHKKVPVRVSKTVPKKVCNNNVVKEFVPVAAVPETVTVPAEVEVPNNIITRLDSSSIEFRDDNSNDVEEKKEDRTKEKLVFSQ